MAVQVKPYTFFNNTTADANEVNSNFDVLYALQAGGIDATNIDLTDDYDWSGIHTFVAQKLRVKGAGAGQAQLEYANSATSRVWTIPDAGAADTFMGLAAVQTVTGAKSFNALTAKIKGAGSGVASLQNANTSNNRDWTLPDIGANATFMALEGAQTISGVKTIGSGGRLDCAAIADALLISSAAPTLDRGVGFIQKTLQYFDSASIKNFLSAHLGVGGWMWNGRLVNDTVNNRVKLVGDDGNDPSSTNPVWVCVPSTTAGKWFVGKITAAKGFDYQGATDSDIIGEEFGVTTGVAWGNNRPFAAYIVNQNDTDAGLEIAISPNPAAKESPATTNIGYLDVPATTPSDNNFFFWTSTNVTATHNAKPCFRFASFRMTMNASDDWAATAFDNGDGIDYIKSYNFGTREYDFPSGQMGAASGKYLLNNGGTAPVFSSNTHKYRIDTSGFFRVYINLSGDGGVDGSGAVNVRIATPYKTQGGVALECAGYWQNPTTNNIIVASFVGASSFMQIFRNNSTTATANILNSDFGNGTRQIAISGGSSAFAS